MSLKNLVFCFATILSMTAIGQNSFNCYYKDDRAIPRQHNVDFTNLSLDIKFEPNTGKVMGKVTHVFTPLQQLVDTLFFDGPGIKINSAILNGSPVKFVTRATGTTIYPQPSLRWDSRNTVIFDYECFPQKGIYFIGWNEKEPTEAERKGFGYTRRQIWTQGQGIDNRHWIPMYDEPNDKVLTELNITFDKNYNVLSNGNKISEKLNGDGTKTWQYKMAKPMSTYLIMIAIDKYGVKNTKSKGGTPVQFWYYPEHPERIEPTSRYTEQMVDFMEAETGMKYPWPTYSQVMVQDFMYGAMENTTATIFGDFFYVDERGYLDRNYVGVNMHEFTHQWFGNFVTARNTVDQWLQESFATHYPKYFTRQVFGEDAFDWARKQEQFSVINSSKTDKMPVRSTQAGSSRVYQKGSNVLDMLRYVLGDSAYKRALIHYLNQHAYGNVETNDMNQAIQDKLGLSLHWFFDEWIYRPGEPTYEVSYATVSAGTQVTVKQVHERDNVIGLFKMPIAIQVYYKDGSSETHMQTIEQETEVFTIQNKLNRQIAFVVFDPNSRVLKSVNFKRLYSELELQLKMATNMLDRYDALLALKEFPLSEKRDALKMCLEKETFYGMRAEAASQLMKDETSREFLSNLYKNEKEVAVRKVMINGWEPATWNKEIFEMAISDSSYDIVQSALEKIVNAAKAGKIDADYNMYLKKVDGIDGMQNSLKIKAMELGANRNPSVIKELTKLSGSNYEFRTRMNAFNALKNINVMDETVAANLFQAITSFNGRLSGPAAAIAEYFAQQTDKRQLMKNVFEKGNFSDGQKQKIRQALKW